MSLIDAKVSYDLWVCHTSDKQQCYVSFWCYQSLFVAQNIRCQVSLPPFGDAFGSKIQPRSFEWLLLIGIW